MNRQLKTNGYYIIKKLLLDNDLNLILNGKLSYFKSLSKTRIKKYNWLGVENNESIYDMKYVKFDKRIDISLPHELCIKLVPNIYKWIENNMSDYKIANCNLLITENNAPNQQYHQDRGDVKDNEYYSLFIPLIDHKKMGKTEIVLPFQKKFPDEPQTITPNITSGDGLLFSGSLWHRGTENKSGYTRYVLYFVLTKNINTFENWK